MGLGTKWRRIRIRLDLESAFISEEILANTKEILWESD